tara:strand:- start:51272 stop:51946 length:675 start_codon:yes stop_codon:yes gene_type:complete
MKWLNQFSLVMRSSVTTLKEKIEDPERMLHQLLLDMEDELDRVRGSVAEAIADEIQLRKRHLREQADADTWSTRASDAVSRGDDAAATRALEQKMQAQERADRFAEEHLKQKSEVEKLQRAVGELQDKIRQAKHKKTLLTARMARAASTQKINQAFDQSQTKSAFAQFSRLEEKVDREEAVTQAWDRLQGRDPDAEELAREFEQQERERKISEELAALKASTNT